MKDTKAVTAKQFREMQARGMTAPSTEPRRSKYNNVPTEVDGIVFKSAHEAARYVALKKDEERGRIRGLKLQYVYPIVWDGVRICDYVADFVYDVLRGGKWLRIVEDAKGYRNDIYRIKRNLMKAAHGITIKET